MKRLKDLIVNPSGLDSLSNYSGEIPDSCWLVVMTRGRDSDILTESNWDAAVEELGGESETVQIFRFGHWAVGWWEALVVKARTEAEGIGEKICKKLENYPVLNEGDFSERETDEANRIWSDCYTVRERIEYIRKHRSQFDFRNFADLRAVVRGDYFIGYASELIA